MPRLERRLLSERKIVKKEMAKMEARLLMHEGKASEKDRAGFAKAGWAMVEPGSLPNEEVEMLKVCVTVLNAQQNALKIRYVVSNTAGERLTHAVPTQWRRAPQYR